MHREVFQALPMSMAILDEDGRVIDVNERWRQFALDNGGDPDAYIGADYLGACGEPGDPETDEVAVAFRDLLSGQRDWVELEYPCHSPDERRWFMLQTYRFHADEATRIAVAHMDITDRRLAEEATREEARHDSLTGLLNRARFIERADQVLAIARRQQTSAAILDLDNFKTINDTRGHQIADRLLKTFATRISRLIRESDAAARYGGDELVIAAAEADAAGARRLTERLGAAIASPVTLGSLEFEVTCSQGVAIYPGDGDDLQALLAAADAAMYRAKTAGPGRVAFAGDRR
jgi:diguanylate cyclase (GGDEF)-like protein